MPNVDMAIASMVACGNSDNGVEFVALAETVDGGDEFCRIDVDVTVAFVFTGKWVSGVAGCLGLRFSVDDELRLLRRDFSTVADALVVKSNVLASQSLGPRLAARGLFCGGAQLSDGFGDVGFGVVAAAAAAAVVISCSPFTSVRPRICSISATRNNGPICA